MQRQALSHQQKYRAALRELKHARKGVLEADACRQAAESDAQALRSQVDNLTASHKDSLSHQRELAAQLGASAEQHQLTVNKHNTAVASLKEQILQRDDQAKQALRKKDLVIAEMENNHRNDIQEKSTKVLVLEAQVRKLQAQSQSINPNIPYRHAKVSFRGWVVT